MVSTITNSTPTQAIASTDKNSKSSQSGATGSSSAKADSVQLSTTAQAILKEATETAAQTAKEAAGGDIQAQKLLLREEHKTTLSKQ